jgi:hypothetical protein
VYLAAIAILGVGAFLLFGNGESSSKESKKLEPECVVAEFFSAMKAGEFKTAENFCNADSMTVYMNAYKQKWNKLSQNDKASFDETVKILSETKLDFTGTEKLDSICIVDYTLEMDGIQKMHQATLRMEEGEWKMVKITDKH